MMQKVAQELGEDPSQWGKRAVIVRSGIAQAFSFNHGCVPVLRPDQLVGNVDGEHRLRMAIFREHVLLDQGVLIVYGKRGRFMFDEFNLLYQGRLRMYQHELRADDELELHDYAYIELNEGFYPRLAETSLNDGAPVIHMDRTCFPQVLSATPSQPLRTVHA